MPPLLLRAQCTVALSPDAVSGQRSPAGSHYLIVGWGARALDDGNASCLVWNEGGKTGSASGFWLILGGGGQGAGPEDGPGWMRKLATPGRRCRVLHTYC